MTDTPQSPADRHGDATPEPAVDPTAPSAPFADEQARATASGGPTPSEESAAQAGSEQGTSAVPAADDTATPPSGARYPTGGGAAYPTQPPAQPYPGQGYSQPYPGQQYPDQGYSTQPYPDHAYPGQPHPGPHRQPGPYGPPPPGWLSPVVVKPGVVPLRPLSVTEILDGSVSTVRRHPKLLLGVSFVVVAVTQVISSLLLYLIADDLELATTVDPSDPSTDLGPLFGSLFGTLGVTLVLTLLAQVFLSGFVTVVVSKAVLGWPVTMREAWDELRQRLLPLLGLTLLFTLIVTVGLVLCVLPGIWLWVLLGLAVPAMMFERQPVMTAFRRSAALVKGSWWRVFGILLLAAVITFLISAILQLPFSLLGVVISGDATGLNGVALAFDTLGAIVGGALIYPISAAVTALVYLDQRMRREGLDIELARAVGAPPPAPGW